ncbi:hypothetical protein S83_058762 [Arachis hypogaea]
MAWRVLTLPPFTGRRDGVITGGAMAAVIAVAPWRDAMHMAEIAGCFGFLHQPSSITTVRRAVRRATQCAARLCSLNTAAHHLLTLLYTMSTSRQVLDSNAPTPASAGPTVGAAPVGPAPAAAVRSNRVDPGWKYISTVEEGNTNDTMLLLNYGSITIKKIEEDKVPPRKAPKNRVSMLGNLT